MFARSNFQCSRVSFAKNRISKIIAIHKRTCSKRWKFWVQSAQPIRIAEQTEVWASGWLGTTPRRGLKLDVCEQFRLNFYNSKVHCCSIAGIGWLSVHCFSTEPNIQAILFQCSIKNVSHSQEVSQKLEQRLSAFCTFDYCVQWSHWLTRHFDLL